LVGKIILKLLRVSLIQLLLVLVVAQVSMEAIQPQRDQVHLSIHLRSEAARAEVTLIVQSEHLPVMAAATVEQKTMASPVVVVLEDIPEMVVWAAQMNSMAARQGRQALEVLAAEAVETFTALHSMKTLASTTKLFMPPEAAVELAY
jgi:hypothetical protein